MRAASRFRGTTIHFSQGITTCFPAVDCALRCHGQAAAELSTGSVTVTDEVPLVRTASLQSGICVAGFRDAVRERDRRCVITGESVPYNFWTGFEAAHVFPLAYEGH